MSRKADRKLNGQTFAITAQSTEINAASEEGKPASFSMLLYAGGPIRPGGWQKPHPLVVDLAGMTVPRGNGQAIPFNRGHAGDNQLVGHGTPQITASEIVIDDGVFSVDNEHSRGIVNASKEGFPWAASMEATLRGTPKFIAAGKSVRVNNRTIQGPVYVARKSELFAGAFIGSNPADRSTHVSIAAKENEMPEALKTWLEAKGVETDGMDEATIKSWQADYDAIQAASSTDEGTTTTTTVTAQTDENSVVTDIRAQASAEVKRIAGITAACGEHTTIQASAIDEGWTVEATETAVLKAENKRLEGLLEQGGRPTGPAIHTSNSEELQSSDVFAASLHQSMDSEVRDTDFVAEVYGEKNAELSKKLPKHAGLQYLCFATIRAAGGHVEPGIGMTNDVWAQAVKADRMLRQNQDIFAASSFSTFSLTDTMSNIAHKMLLRMYRDWDSLVDRICDTAEHADFKEHTKIAVEGDVETLQLPPTGEIKHGTMSDAKYTNIIYTWARMLSVTRPDFFNDDLGAFSRIGQFLGRGAMKSREKLMWLTILNPALVGTFWKDAAQSGLATGQDAGVVNRITGGTVSTATLDAAELLVKQMTDETGHPIMIGMDSLISGTVEGKAWDNLLVKRTTSVYDQNQAAGTARQELRIEDEWLGRVGHVETPYMDARIAIPGSADNLRFLLGDKDYPAFEYARLRGEGSPNIDSADTDFNTLGFQTRIYWDYGFKEQNPRGMVRIEG